MRHPKTTKRSGTGCTDEAYYECLSAMQTQKASRMHASPAITCRPFQVMRLYASQ